MRTQQALKTIEWLDNEFGDVRNSILGFLRSTGRENFSDIPTVKLAHKLGRFAEVVKGNPDAITVLNAFNLSDLADSGFIDVLAGAAQKDPKRREVIADFYRRWIDMAACRTPLEKLTSFKVELGEDEEELDINVADRETLTIKSVIEVLSDRVVSVNWWKSSWHQPSTSEQLTESLLTPPPFVN